MLRLTEKQAAKLGLIEQPKENKYRNIPVTIDGHRFPSEHEGYRYNELKLMLRAGEIRKLELQPVFVLQSGKNVTIKYIADFRYIEVRTDHEVVEDVKSKGTTTAVYKLKKKLLLHQYPGIDFREVF